MSSSNERRETKRSRVTRTTVNRFFASHKTRIEQLRTQMQQYANQNFVNNFDVLVKQKLPKVICDLKKEYTNLQQTSIETNKKMIENIEREWQNNFPTADSKAHDIDILGDIFRKCKLTETSNIYPGAYYLPYELISCGQHIQQIHIRFEPLLDEAKRVLWKLETALQLMMPLLEATNDHGARAQKRVKFSITILANFISSFLYESGGGDESEDSNGSSNLLTYARTRIKLLEDRFNYFQVKDAHHQLVQLEQEALQSTQNQLNDIITQLTLLQHQLVLNLDTIKKPQINQELVENIIN